MTRSTGGDGTRVAARTGGPAGFTAALGALRAAQKPPRGVSLYSRYVNRPLGRVLAAAAHRARLVPDQVTLLSAASSFAGVAAVALVRPSWGVGVAVWAALALGFALDSADGQLARLRGGGSPAGEWLDHVVDCAKIVALHSAVLISFHRFGDPPSEAWLLLPLAFQLVAVLLFFAGLLTDKLRPRRAPGPAGAPSTWRAVALLPVDHGVFCLVFLLLGAPGLFRIGYAVLFAASALFLVAFGVRWFRELSAAPRG
ncbi:CDP-alcohol phosphatidyltransferase family protein [Streptomyces albus]|uniref:CDP-alcohol phosphatidyltransferase family protein n=1 Tax=Streptomyces TaxID=1883 RepID=UPI001F094514|nr:CDP-alcohol phosphatidyltransferase family protein [Streptomyces albus]